MASNIIAAIRQHSQLKGNLKFTALEIAHRMNRSGYVTMAHQMMAWKTGYSLRTAYRHTAQLCAMGIFRKTVYRTANGYGQNLYKCLLPLPAFYRTAPATTHNDRVSGTLPDYKAEEAKELSIREEIRLQKKGLQFLMQGSDRYQACIERLAMLEAMVEARAEVYREV